MNRSLQGKLILSYLAVALITVLVVSTLIWLTSGQSLMNLVQGQQTALMKESVQAYYTANGTLDGYFYRDMQSHPEPNSNPLDTTGSNPPDAPTKFSKSRELRGVLGLVDSEYRAVFPTAGYDIGQVVPQDKIKNAVAVDVDGKTIAWILPDTSNKFNLSPEEILYQQRTALAIGLAALTGILAAVTMGFVLAGRLLQPIRRLTAASQALAHGALEQKVPVTSRDELGQLTETFNQMSADLSQADQQRKRMTADITHDLSTPLQIIAGYIEMLEDGGVTLTPHRLEIIKTEIGHLRRLVSDLTTLTQVEGGGLDIQTQPVQPGALLEQVYHTYQIIANRQGVELVLDLPASVQSIQVDEGRMLQVLKNLVENALRYTPADGKITLSAAEVDGSIQLRVSDTGSGIDAEDLPYVFDRFYRADKARGANSGKMGLGLAICKALVTAQKGVIAAESAGKDRGASMVITF